MTKKDQTVVITARIPKEMNDRITEYCDYVEGLTKSHLINKCIEMEIARFNDCSGLDPIVPEDSIYVPDQLEIADSMEF
jgi:hypothetical protein